MTSHISINEVDGVLEVTIRPNVRFRAPVVHAIAVLVPAFMVAMGLWLFLAGHDFEGRLVGLGFALLALVLLGAFLYMILWEYVGREVLHLDPQWLVIESWLFAWCFRLQRYRVGELRGLRMGRRFRTARGAKFWSAYLEFDYDGRTVEFAEGLPEDE